MPGRKKKAPTPGTPDNRGGYQRPSNPAVMSGGGATSQRTDGGPGDFRSTFHGSGDAMRQLDGVVRDPATPGPAPGGSGGAAPGAPISIPDPFRPAEAGMPAPSPSPELAFPDDPDLVIRALYHASPNADMLRLLEGRMGGIG